MKKIFLPMSFLFTACTFAQPVINYNEFPIAIGDVITIYPQTGYITPTEGENQIWDYTNLNALTPTTTNIISPTTSSIANLEPSTLCSARYGKVECYLIDTTGIQRTGLSDLTADLTYQDAEYVLKFPISFGSTSVDTYYSNYITSTFLATRRGTVSISVTGYGTMQLPNSLIINNAMQVKLHEVAIDSVNVYGNWQVLHTDIITHQFYAENHHGSILDMFSGTMQFTTLNQDTTFTVAGIIYNTLTSGAGIETHDISSNLLVYPNPVDDIFSLTNNGNIELNNFEYSIINLQGQTIKTGIINSNDFSFDASNLKTGVYVININGGNFNASKRIFKK